MLKSPENTPIMNNKFQGYLILSDIDGTLTDNRGRISDENAAAIRYFQENGGLMTVASGRYPWYIEKYADTFRPNTYVVGINGTMLYDAPTKTPVITKVFEDDFLSVLHEFLDLCPQVTYILVSGHKEEFNIRREDFPRLDEILADLEKPWCRIILCQHPDDGEKTREALVPRYGDRYNFDFSWCEGLEVHPKGSGKGDLLREMLPILAENGHPIHTTVCAGDYENDLSMMEAVDIGYAGANAIPSVKAAAKRITVSNNDSALAKIIADIEAEIDAK